MYIIRNYLEVIGDKLKMGEGEKESWNMANATLKRLDNLLRQSSVYSQTSQLFKWKNCLMDLRRNIYPFLSETEVADVDNKFKSLDPNWNRNGRVSPKHYAKTNRLFDEIYIIFITVMKKKGLLMPKTVDSGKAVIEM